MRKILVTGGAGFIGSHLVRALLSEEDRVFVLDDFSTGSRDNLLEHNRLIILEGSITDSYLLEHAIEGVDHVVHLAAQTSVFSSVEAPFSSFKTNVSGFSLLLDTLRKKSFGGRLVYASSAAVYGESIEYKALKEEDSNGMLPLSGYALDKCMNEQLAELYQRLYRINSVGLRFFNVYGPRQHPSSPYAGVISTFVDKVRKKEKLEVYGDGEQKRDFIYVDDIISVILRCLVSVDESNDVYNVGSGEAVSLNQLISTLEEVFMERVQKSYKSARIGDIYYSCADISRLRSFLGSDFSPRSLSEGLRDWLAWS
jgi:UDP-glucose 4-epimerase